MQRKVGCQHGDARSFLVPLWHKVGDLPTDRRAGDQQLVAASIVRLEQYADGKPLAGQLDNARRSADTALEVEELSAGTGANTSLLDWPLLRGVQRGVD